MGRLIFSFVLCTILLISIVKTDSCNITDPECIIDIKTKQTVDFEKECQKQKGGKPCLMKCCPENEIMAIVPKTGQKRKCFSILNNDIAEAFKAKYDDITIKDKLEIEVKNVLNSSIAEEIYTTLIATRDGKTIGVSFLNDYRLLYSNRFLENEHSGSVLKQNWDFNENGTLNARITQGNIVTLYQPPHFCLDFTYSVKSKVYTVGRSYETFIYHTIPEDHPEKVLKIKIVAYVTLVSVFFMILVLIVHGLLKGLHGNLGAKMLMYFTLNLSVFYLLLASYSLAVIYEAIKTRDFCVWLSPFMYFVLLCAFFFLNAMGFDFWRKCRTVEGRRIQTLEEQSNRKRLRKYTVYAVGLALTATAAALAVEHWGADGVSKPNFQNCMEIDDTHILPRLYKIIPIGFVVFSNTAMWVFTVLVVRENNMENRTKANKDKATAVLYGKLFLLMGVTWILEITGQSIPDLNIYVEYVLSIPNAAIGVLLFIITCCKKKVVVGLCKRFGIENEWTRQDTTRTQYSNVSRSKSGKSVYSRKASDTPGYLPANITKEASKEGKDDKRQSSSLVRFSS